jgi:hypothetical protein
VLRPPAIIGALLLAAASLGAAEPRTEAFAVGVMRRDGVLVPFAAFDGKRWVATWFAPTREMQIPINLQSVPKSWWGPTTPQPEWQLWPLPPGGAAARTVRVTQPDWVQTHCLRQIALRTDYRAERPIPPWSEQPYPKDGIAIAPGQPIERVDVVAPQSAEAQDLRGVVTAAFDKAERDLAGRFTHPIKTEAREKVAVNLEAVYAFGASPRFYYVESARGYRVDDPKAADGCAMAFGTGWFIKDADNRVKKLDMVVDLLPCSMDGATYMLPFGVVHAAGRAFWLAQYSGWKHERYMVIELKKNNVEALVATYGGGC